MIKKILTTMMACAFVLSNAANAQDPVKSTDDAYSMGVYYKDRDYKMVPSIDGVDGSGAKISFLVPITKGIDYVFLAGRDEYIKDLDIYIYDETNALILKDRRSSSRAGVKFRASYTGTVRVILHVAKANGLGAWSVIVGRRGGGERLDPVDPNVGPAKQ
jgi:hypothetical protein